jgi:hypothetical protein
MAEETAEQKLKRYGDVLDAYMAEVTKLRSENERLRADADAHGVLKSIYLDPDAPQSLRVKAASSALPVEKPRLMSVETSSGPSRFARWRAYERYRLKKEILTKTGQPPVPGWDAHLVDGVYEPPDGDSEPPLDLYGRDAIQALVTISGLVRAGRNGNGGDEPSEPSGK